MDCKTFIWEKKVENQVIIYEIQHLIYASINLTYVKAQKAPKLKKND